MNCLIVVNRPMCGRRRAVHLFISTTQINRRIAAQKTVRQIKVPLILVEVIFAQHRIAGAPALWLAGQISLIHNRVNVARERNREGLRDIKEVRSYWRFRGWISHIPKQAMG